MTGPLSLPPFRITARDEVMLYAIARFRLLSPTLLLRVAGGSPRGVRNRLALLAAHKYVVRLRSTLTEPHAYGLANKGAKFLAARGYNINARLDWTAKNHRGDYFRAHTLAIAETMLHFHRATTEHGVGLLDHHELLPYMPDQTQNVARPFSFQVASSYRDRTITIQIQPDRLFAFTYPDARHNFALEQDLGTMDIWANRLVGKSSIRRKHIGYMQGRQQLRFVRRWGFKSFRVLIVTSSEARIQTMLRAQSRVAAHCPPGFFLYSTLERLARYGALGPAWSTTKRDNVSLLPTTSKTPLSIEDSAPSADAVAGVKREMLDMPTSQA